MNAPECRTLRRGSLVDGGSLADRGVVVVRLSHRLSEASVLICCEVRKDRIEAIFKVSRIRTYSSSPGSNTHMYEQIYLFFAPDTAFTAIKARMFMYKLTRR